SALRRWRRLALSRAIARSLGFAATSSLHLQQAHQVVFQHGKRRILHVRFGVYDEIPSCGNLLAMEPDQFSYASPHAIAHHRATERSLDAKAKAALRQFVRFQEHGEVGTRAA